MSYSKIMSDTKIKEYTYSHLYTSKLNVLCSINHDWHSWWWCQVQKERIDDIYNHSHNYWKSGRRTEIDHYSRRKRVQIKCECLEWWCQLSCVTNCMPLAARFMSNSARRVLILEGWHYSYSTMGCTVVCADHACGPILETTNIDRIRFHSHTYISYVPSKIELLEIVN